MQPSRPKDISQHAERCIQALAAAKLGSTLSLGGAFGLLHYHDYRPTHDVDAWWNPEASADEREQVGAVVRHALQPAGEVRVRSWGEVTSIELLQAGKKVFSFQVARRSAQLEAPIAAPWTDVLLDSFADLVASKMVALVERGAPRDFRDIHAICQADLTTAEQCWRWWRQRQHLAQADATAARARLAVATHLARIERHRPLEAITDRQQRADAEGVRRWFKEELLHALVD